MYSFFVIYILSYLNLRHFIYAIIYFKEFYLFKLLLQVREVIAGFQAERVWALLQKNPDANSKWRLREN